MTNEVGARCLPVKCDPQSRIARGAHADADVRVHVVEPIEVASDRVDDRGSEPDDLRSERSVTHAATTPVSVMVLRNAPTRSKSGEERESSSAAVIAYCPPAVDGSRSRSV